MDEPRIVAIREEFDRCLEKFPELDDVELIVEEASELSGACGRRGNRRVVVLFAPPELLSLPAALRPIMYHELSHAVNLENPDEVFFARADEQSKRMWRLLEGASALHCEVVQENDETAIHPSG